jgi:hypothetical protein
MAIVAGRIADTMQGNQGLCSIADTSPIVHYCRHIIDYARLPTHHRLCTIADTSLRTIADTMCAV